MSTRISKQIAVRFPPSPTGFMHIGRARTALFNFLFAKRNGGAFIFRVEDTDKERSKKEFEDDIVESLKWLGIVYDSGPVRQSERGEIYKKYLDTLIADGKAYISKEPEGENREVVRFKNPNTKISFQDLIRGTIEFDTTELEDFVIARNIHEPLYHLAVVVDDFEMGVTHIIRGEDGISNTPRQILIQDAIGAPRPLYAHVPLILAPDKSKLSGRHGAVSVREYREKGYLPEALVNYLALLGWNPGTDQEILSMQELIEKFDLAHVQKSGAIFNPEKLNWLNKEYLKKKKASGELDPKKLLPPEIQAGKSGKQINLLFETLFERISRLPEITELLTGDFKYLIEAPEYESTLLTWKKDKNPEQIPVRLKKIVELIEKIEKDFNPENIKAALWDFAESEGRGAVLGPLRVALSGRAKSPDPFTLSAILGKEETRARLETAIKKLSR